MGLIQIEGMAFYAYHGHFAQEQVVGNKFIVNLEIDTDLSKPAISDNLDDALDYQKAYNIVKKEMETKSFLLENIAERILNSLYEAFENQIVNARVKISKINPPMGGQIEKVSVTMSK